MKIAAHITFYYLEERFKYLKEVVDSLLQIDADIQIYIHTNRDFELFQHIKNVHLTRYAYNKKGMKSFYHPLSRLGLRPLLHPYFLTWENRKTVEAEIENYDVQIYLEDDIKFTRANLDYWLEHYKAVMEKGYNLGFLRVEEDGEKRWLTDPKKPLQNVIELDRVKYLLNDVNPYCGFWIYSKEQLKEFTKSKEWRFRFKKFGIREKAAIGWHGKHMNRFKGTIIPLKEGTKHFVTENNCTVHHLPNNYVDDEAFCSLEFPVLIPKNAI